jgi:endonuclease-3 related protein
MEVYRTLLRAYGPQGWWPVTPPGGRKPRYTGGPRTAAQRFEVAVGAVLTQNTAWVNAERAIEALNARRVMNPRALESIPLETLARAIRPSGYYNQKAKKLKVLASHFACGKRVTRESLLGLNGIGPETADSILLYSLGTPNFVVDAYTRRVFGRLGLVGHDSSYEEIRKTFEGNLPRRARLYQEYHALIVEHGKKTCKKGPVCEQCVIEWLCESYRMKHRGVAGDGRSQTILPPNRIQQQPTTSLKSKFLKNNY